MLDYVTKRRNTNDDTTGWGYVVVLRNRHGASVPISSPFMRGCREGVEHPAVRRLMRARDGGGYRSGFHLFTTLDGAVAYKNKKALAGSVIMLAKFRGRVCHGLNDGHRVTVAKNRTLIKVV